MKKINLIIIGIMILLVIWSFIIRGNFYYVGGDDMRLYYIFPQNYLKNYAFNLITGNTLAGAQTGYAPVSYYAPMYLIIWLLKLLIPVNVQSLLFGLNLSFGFMFFYLLVKEILTPQKRIEHAMIVVSALFYIFSPFLIQTLLKHQMLTQYLISVMPAVLYFVLLSVKKEKVHYAILAVLVFSIFSSTLGTLPWSLGFVLGTLPFWLYLFFINRQAFIKSSLVAAISFVGINLYWIFHLIYPIFVKNGSTFSYYSTPEFEADNLRIIQGVSRLYRPTDILFLNADRELINPFLEYLKAVFIISIILCGIILFLKKSKLRIFYILGLLSFLISWYLFSPNIDEWGPSLFLKFVTSVPFFTMFRNMQDKFAAPLAFNFAFLFALALTTFSKYFKKISIIVSIIALAAIFTNSPGFFLTLADEKDRYFSGEFSKDYTNLINEIDQIEDESRIVWLPLNFPTYVNVHDFHTSECLYSGLSPMRVLIGKDDYTGTFSFMSQHSLSYGYEIFDLIETEDFEQAGRYFQQFNAGYVIVRDETLPLEIAQYMYGGEGLPLLEIQNEQFMNQMIGEKIRNFGELELYKINPNYDSQRVFLTNSIQDPFAETQNVEYEKVREGEYLISLNPGENGINLVILDPYSDYWKITAFINNEEVPLEFENNNLKPLGNLFRISLDDLIQNEKVKLRVFFQPMAYNHYLLIISSLITLISATYIIFKSATGNNK